MTLISGFVGLLTALDPAGGTAVVEASGAGYGRQPVRFGTAVSGISKLSAPYSFGSAKVGQTVGRGIWSAPSGGYLLLVLPYGNGPRLQPSGAPVDSQDVGGITLSIVSMAAYPDGEAFSGTILPAPGGNVVGAVYDSVDEVLAPWAATAGPSGVARKAIATGALMAPGAGDLTARNGSISFVNPQ